MLIVLCETHSLHLLVASPWCSKMPQHTLFAAMLPLDLTMRCTCMLPIVSVDSVLWISPASTLAQSGQRVRVAGLPRPSPSSPSSSTSSRHERCKESQPVDTVRSSLGLAPWHLERAVSLIIHARHHGAYATKAEQASRSGRQTVLAGEAD